MKKLPTLKKITSSLFTVLNLALAFLLCVLFVELFVKPSLDEYLDKEIISRQVSFEDYYFSEHVTRDHSLYAKLIEHDTADTITTNIRINENFSAEYESANLLILTKNSNTKHSLYLSAKYIKLSNTLNLKYRTQFRETDKAWLNIISDDVSKVISNPDAIGETIAYTVFFDKEITLSQASEKFDEMIFTDSKKKKNMKADFYNHVITALPYPYEKGKVWTFYFQPIVTKADKSKELTLVLRKESQNKTFEGYKTHYER